MSDIEKPHFPHEIPPSEPTVPFPTRPRKKLEGLADKTVRLPRSLEEAVAMSGSVDELLTNIRRIYHGPADETRMVLEHKGTVYPLADGLVELGIKTWQKPDDIPAWVTPEMRAKLIEWMGTV